MAEQTEPIKEPELQVIEHSEEEYAQHRMGVRTATPPAEQAKEQEKQQETEQEKAQEKAPEKKEEQAKSPVEALTQDTVDYKTEYEKLKGEVEKNKSTNPYTNINYYKLDTLEKQDPEKAKLYQRLVFGEPDPKELWKLNFLKDHPDATASQVQRRLEKRFPPLFDSALTSEDADYKDASDDLDLEAKAIKREMMKEFDAIKVPDAAKADADSAAEVTTLVESWKPSFTRMTGETKFDVKVGDGDQAETFSFEIPETEKRKYFEAAAHYLLANKIKADQEGYTKVRDFMVRSYVSDNYTTLMGTIAKTVATKKEEEMLSKITNSSAIQHPKEQIPSGGARSSQEILDANLAAAERATQR